MMESHDIDAIRYRVMKEMEDYQLRMITEYDDLKVKLDNLKKFMSSDKYSALDSEKRYLLAVQCKAMDTYLEVLGARLSVEGIKATTRDIADQKIGDVPSYKVFEDALAAEHPEVQKRPAPHELLKQYHAESVEDKGVTEA